MMDRLESAGDVGIYVKCNPELRDACKEYGVDVSETARKALVAAVVRRAGEEALRNGNKKTKKGPSR